MPTKITRIGGGGGGTSNAPAISGDASASANNKLASANNMANLKMLKSSGPGKSKLPPPPPSALNATRTRVFGRAGSKLASAVSVALLLSAAATTCVAARQRCLASPRCGLSPKPLRQTKRPFVRTTLGLELAPLELARLG